ncbi:hypothetical protein [Chitinophaga sp. LS1]|uniref:hypothetical protein n=1 Tax=Chitinophaga sp. LS1 TaxID=3051176 RepID=UPI002AAAAA07|nr:hypothetical protein [Chitinophaga sp. LS1]WPV67865.1 hypothetical protein QQL36_03895 [Chitinophaga sp. LS1]
MQISGLRILPPIAIGRLGSSSLPMDAFRLDVDPTNPLDFRKITVEESYKVDPATGIMTKFTPEKVIFKDATNIDVKNGTVRPVAPFLEVFAITTDNPDQLVPLTIDLLTKAGYNLDSISWHVHLANIKLYRRTQSEKDKINAEITYIQSHQLIPVDGECANFVSGRKLPLGHVQFIQPTTDFPQIRFRFTPGPGRIYGCSTTRIPDDGSAPEPDPLYLKYGDDFLLYSKDGDWFNYVEGNQERPILTNPAGIFAGYDQGNNRVSWGYVDDECDGRITIELKKSDGTLLTASAHVCAGPPAYAPDTLPVRVVTDEIEQILLGPDVDKEVPIEEAQEIVRRALETVRLMNTAIMNGNNYYGRPRPASMMPAQDSNDFGRMYEPIMAPSIVDNLAVRAIHERVFNGIGTPSTSTWFDSALRRPDTIGNLSNEERRKMPAMMRGADGRALCFTYRQIHTIIQSAASAMFQAGATKLNTSTTTSIPVADVYGQLHYKGNGNPYSVMARSAISNCFPGLEMDFRNLWRRAFKGITLIENNNFIVETEEEFSHLLYHRLVGVAGKPTMVPTQGPTFPRSGNLPLINTFNPNGVSFMEWSNGLAYVLQHQGKEVECYFTKDESNTEVVVSAADLNTGNANLVRVVMTVNNFFEENSTAINNDIINAGELTQGLCAPWQNDYRECACYYWAASRPDYVNVVPGPDGISRGDNWMAKKRSGNYIPDNRADSRLLTYDDLFLDWEGELNFLVKGNDALDSDGGKKQA